MFNISYIQYNSVNQKSTSRALIDQFARSMYPNSQLQSVSKPLLQLPRQLLRRVVHDRRGCTSRIRIVRCRAVGRHVLVNWRVDHIFTRRDRKSVRRTKANMSGIIHLQDAGTHVSCRLAPPAARACDRTAARNVLTSSTINVRIPSTESSSSNPKSNA
jgi:hypothetical protein